ncbi:MAG: transcriptional repressor [Planctomycetaceae bacterium]|nr:transcriptional repressor [Planctomycetaceae bacterium]
MKHDAIRKSFERFLRTRDLKLTPQRARIFERAFATHEHFSAETLYDWMRAEEGPKVSRATVYRTLGLLLEGHFIQSLDTGRGELVYEHVTGHSHHDHMVCLACGKIEEFHDPRIEALQDEACAKKGFVVVSHAHRLVGYCRGCARKNRAQDELESVADEPEAPEKA